MLKSTTIVSILFATKCDFIIMLTTFYSIGTVSSKKAPTGLMDPPLSINAQLPPATLSSTTSILQIKLVSVIGRCASWQPIMLMCILGTFWYHSHLSTQYCDGLRGPFVVYDPNDPHASLYDVDDESTVITLADWYHTLARLGSAFPCV